MEGDMAISISGQVSSKDEHAATLLSAAEGEVALVVSRGTQ